MRTLISILLTTFFIGAIPFDTNAQDTRATTLAPRSFVIWAEVSRLSPGHNHVANHENLGLFEVPNSESSGHANAEYGLKRATPPSNQLEFS